MCPVPGDTSAIDDLAFRTVVTRGTVHWIDLDERRPCVVVSSDDVLSVDVWQTHVVPITSNVGRAGIAGNVLLPTRASGLPEVLIGDIDKGLRAVLGI